MKAEGELIQEFKKMPSAWRPEYLKHVETRADSSSTRLRSTCQKEAHPVQEESCGKSTRTTNDRLLVFSLSFIFIFNFSFAFFYILLACLTDLFLFFAGMFEYFHP